MFVGYPKGTRGGIFYSHLENKVFTSTTATFSKNDYVQNFKPRSKVVLEEMVKELTPTNVPSSFLWKHLVTFGALGASGSTRRNEVLMEISRLIKLD